MLPHPLSNPTPTRQNESVSMRLLRYVPATCLALALCALVAGCASGPTIRTSYEPAADFTRFKSFALNHPNHPTPVSGGVDPFMVFRLRQMVYSQLKAQSYTPASFDQAQLLVTVNAETRTHTEASPAGPYGYGYGYGYSHYDVETTPTLLLSIDLVDAKTQAVVWHGTGEILTRSQPDEAELWGLVQAILARFPPTGSVENE